MAAAHEAWYHALAAIPIGDLAAAIDTDGTARRLADVQRWLADSRR
jgi:hypothetical protein